MSPVPQIPSGFFPELVAIDVDDTLIGHDGVVIERASEAIRQAREAGIRVALATGRSPSTSIPVARAAGTDDLAVCSNGALLVDVPAETTIDAITFDPRPVLEELVEHVPNAIFAVEDVTGLFRTTRMFGSGPLSMSVREVPFDHLLTEPIVRVVVRSEEHVEQGFGALVELLGYQSVVYGIGEVAWLDVGPKGVNKATMLQRLCERCDIDPARTLVIGDSWNDMAMLSWAGVGVVMDSAPEPVRALATTVTSAVPGEGVADVLEALLR